MDTINDSQNTISRYTVRIMLSDTADANYVTLYDALEGFGFTNEMEGTDGKKYKLPNAEYNYISSETIDVVMNHAIRATKRTGLDFKILISQSTNRKYCISNVSAFHQ